MEDEAFFIFLIYTQQSHSPVIKDNKETWPYSTVIKRASLQKNERTAAGYSYKRVAVDFDPSQTQVAYAVAVISSVSDSYSCHMNGLDFAGIVQTEDEADELKTRLESGEYKPFVVKKHKFEKVKIYPVLVSRN